MPGTTSDETSGLLPAVRDRWSPRAFDRGHGLAAEDLALLVEAARWAPSAGNSQPWAFILGRRGDETFACIHGLLARGNQVWAGRASALVITLHQALAMPGSDLPFSDYAAYDLGQATAQMVLQAQAMGLHAHQFAGFDHERAAAEFAVPDHWMVTTGMAIGRRAPASSLEPALAAREQAPRERKPAAAIAFTKVFGRPLLAGALDEPTTTAQP